MNKAQQANHSTRAKPIIFVVRGANLNLTRTPASIRANRKARLRHSSTGDCLTKDTDGRSCLHYDAYEISVTFAGIRDSGLNQGYWIGYWSRDFGWGIAEAGHNFTFVNADDWQQAVTGSLLSHMGKHGPMILTRPEGLNENAVRYLEMVKPTWGAPDDQLNNHGCILGSTDKISWQAQADIDWLLEPKDMGE